MKLSRYLLLCVSFCGTPSVLADSMVYIDLGPGSEVTETNNLTAAGIIEDLHDVSGRETGIRFELAGGGQPFAIAPAKESLPGGSVDLSSLDGNYYQFNGTLQARLSGMSPNTDYDVYVFGLRGGAALKQTVDLRGSTHVRFEQSAPDGWLAVNDGVGSVDSNLDTYAKRVRTDRAGGLQVLVIGEGPQGKPFTVAGLALSPSASSGANVISTPVKNTRTPAPTKKYKVDAGRDIVGIYLDMPIAEAAPLIKAQNPREVDIPFSEGDTGGFPGSRLRGHKFPFLSILDNSRAMQGFRQKLIVTAFGPPNEGRVSGVSRTVYPAEPILWEDMLPALIEKYGPPLYNPGIEIRNRVASYTVSWSTDKNGRPLTQREDLLACVTDDVTSMVMYTREENLGFQKHCGSILSYTMYSAVQRQDYVYHYSAVLVDLPLILARNKELVRFTKGEARKIEAQNKQDAKGRKPSL